jgi:hypothetical protein
VHVCLYNRVCLYLLYQSALLLAELSDKRSAGRVLRAYNTWRALTLQQRPIHQQKVRYNVSSVDSVTAVYAVLLSVLSVAVWPPLLTL